MITFKEYLTEIFDKPYTFKYIGKHPKWPDRHDYSFNTPHDKGYKVSFYHGLGGSDDNAEVEFADGVGNFDINKRQGHNAHQIFSTVKHVIKHHLDTHPEIKSISFSGSEKSRVKLYDRLVSKFSSARRHNIDDDDPNDPTDFGKYYIHRRQFSESYINEDETLDSLKTNPYRTRIFRNVSVPRLKDVVKAHPWNEVKFIIDHKSNFIHGLTGEGFHDDLGGHNNPQYTAGYMNYDSNSDSYSIEPSFHNKAHHDRLKEFSDHGVKIKGHGKHNFGDHKVNESILSEGKVERLTSKNGNEFKLYHNPDKAQARAMIGTNKNKSMRSLKSGNDHYVWDAYHAIHSHIADHIGADLMDCTRGYFYDHELRDHDYDIPDVHESGKVR